VHEGATPETALNAFLGSALLQTGCDRGYEQAVLCAEKHQHPQDCSGCSLPKIYKPSGFARPVRLCFDGSFSGQTHFSMEMVMLGQRALQGRQMILKALTNMASQGFILERAKRISFRILEIREQFNGTIQQRSQMENPAPEKIERVMIEFITPFIHQETVDGTAGEKYRPIQATGNLPLPKVLGNMANNLMRWHIEDQGFGGKLSKREIDDIAQNARMEAEAFAEDVRLEKSVLVPISLGLRASNRTGYRRPLNGFIGYAVFAGNFVRLIDWLEALRVWGGGLERTLGFGWVRLWKHYN
jgi:hypothetical protein